MLPRVCAGEKKVFLIVSGRSDLIRIGEELEAAGLSGVELTIGYQLSYREERILARNAGSVPDVKGRWTLCLPD